MTDANGTAAAASPSERALAAEREALDAILGDFEIEQRRALTMAVNRAIDTAIREQGDMLASVKTRVAARQRAAIEDLRDELARQQPSTLELVIGQTLDTSAASGLLHWIAHPQKQQQARDCVERLRSHLEARQGNLFRSDFEALLVVYMEYLNIPMASGSRLSNRIEDFKDALHRQASSTDDLMSLSYRVNWACYGVRTIGNARSHDTTPLSDSEMLELCGCFSALGAAMPTLALEFDVMKPDPVGDEGGSPAKGSATTTNGDAPMDLSAFNNQLRQLAGSNITAAPNDFERLLQLLAAGLNNNGGSVAAAPPISTVAATAGNLSAAAQAPPLPPGFPPLPPGNPPLPPPDSTSVPPGFVASTTTPSVPRRWANDPAIAYSPLRKASPTAHKTARASSPTPPPPPQPIAPSQRALEAVPSFKFYHERPTDLPKESDRTRMAMFARMINHMNLVPKARLCPFFAGHDASCPLSHSYMEVMTYNPLFKRLICRQPSHYWASQVAEDENCVCLHVDTGLTWDWLDETRDKRTYCIRGSKCTNNKCYKSHSFEEMCWYNPVYKVKKCAIRGHDHIVRARGTTAPPLDCNYYHIEVGPNADMRQLMVEDDHVGKPVKLLFAERTHKPLADALEALRYARTHNL